LLCLSKKRFWTQAGFLVSSLESESVDEDLPMMVDELASMVAVSGDHVEEIARARNVGEEALA
jgi:hypothetical protein